MRSQNTRLRRLEGTRAIIDHSGSESMQPPTKKIKSHDVTISSHQVINKKKERQKRYREQNREKLKRCEAERRKRIHSQSIPEPSTSLNTNTLEVNKEEIISALQKKRENQQRYRERNRDKLKQREAERRRRLQNAEMIIELSTSPNTESTEFIIIEPIITIDELSTDSQSVADAEEM